MAPQQTSLAAFSFGPFEVDLQTQELKKQGVRLRLPGQSLQILLMLLQKPGQLVPREELQQALWPSDTFVDFEKGLNAAINRLRETLGDSAENPRYVETLPRRGYRFIAPVGRRDAIIEVPEHSPTPERPPRLTGSKRLALLASFLCLLVLSVIFISAKLRSTLPTPKVVDSVQITKDGLPKDGALKLLTDGKRLYFQEGVFAGPMSFVSPRIQGAALVQVSTQGGETARVPLVSEEAMIYDISPTRSEVVAGGHFKDEPSRPLWVVPLLAGPPHRLGDVEAHDACWSPDGSYLVFANGKELFVAKPDGSDIRKLAALDGYVYWIRFSPDGTRLRFTAFTLSARPEDWDIMEIAADGSGLHRLPIHGCCGKWSADGKYYFYQTSRDIWVLPERRTIFGGVELGIPGPLTAGPIAFGAPTPSTDGKQLFVVGNQQRIELVHYESKTKQFVPFLGGISAGELEVSPDSQWVTYTTFPESNLWRSKLDGSERLQLTFAPINAHEPRWSPDGKTILFTDVPGKIFLVPLDGGRPQEVTPRDQSNQTEVGAGFWLPDGDSIVFVKGSVKTPYAIYRLSLKTQEVSKIPGSDGMAGARVSPDGRYMTAGDHLGRTMLYDFQTLQWSEFARGRRFEMTTLASGTWSHDSKSVYSHRKNGNQSGEVVRISVPDGKVERVLDLKGITLGGFWPGWISLLPDDSPLLMVDKSTQEIYRLDLQYR